MVTGEAFSAGALIGGLLGFAFAFTYYIFKIVDLKRQIEYKISEKLKNKSDEQILDYIKNSFLR